jgi:hypothetical protein
MTDEASPSYRWYTASFRTTLAYLSLAFLISAPLRFILDEAGHHIIYSLSYGIILGVGALVFLPFGSPDWRNMSVPIFKRFELGVFRNATVLAGVFFAAHFVWEEFFPPPEIGSLVFVLMLFSYFKGKAHMFFFRGFYRAEEKENGDGKS